MSQWPLTPHLEDPLMKQASQTGIKTELEMTIWAPIYFPEFPTMIATQDPKTKFLLNFMKMEGKVEATGGTGQPRKFSMKNHGRNSLSLRKLIK